MIMIATMTIPGRENGSSDRENVISRAPPKGTDAIRARSRDFFLADESIPRIYASGDACIYSLRLRVRHIDRFDREKSTHKQHRTRKKHTSIDTAVTRLLRTGKHTSEIPVTPLPRTDAQMAEGNAHWFARDPSDSARPAGRRPSNAFLSRSFTDGAPVASLSRARAPSRCLAARVHGGNRALSRIEVKNRRKKRGINLHFALSSIISMRSHFVNVIVRIVVFSCYYDIILSRRENR